MPRKLRVYNSRHPEGRLFDVEVNLEDQLATNASGELVADRVSVHPDGTSALISLLPSPGEHRHSVLVVDRQRGQVLWRDPSAIAATWSSSSNGLVVLREKEGKKSLALLRWPVEGSSDRAVDVESLDKLTGVLSMVSVERGHAVLVVSRTPGDLGYSWFNVAGDDLVLDAAKSTPSVEAYSRENQEVFYWGPVVTADGEHIVVSAGNAAHIDGLRRRQDVSALPVGWVFVHHVPTAERKLYPVHATQHRSEWADVFDLLVLSEPKIIDDTTIEVMAYAEERIQLKLDPSTHAVSRA